MAIDIHQGRSRTLKILYTRLDGSEAKVDGNPSWTIVGQAGLRVAEDQRSAVISHNGIVGLAVVTVTADADLSDGVSLLLTEEAFNMVGPEGKIDATNAVIIVGNEENPRALPTPEPEPTPKLEPTPEP